MNHISLFAGIGGIDIAAEWAGFQTICFVEKNPYCQKVLKKHWPDTPIIGDVKDVTKEKIDTIAASYRLERRGMARSQGNRQPTRVCEEPKERIQEIMADTTHGTLPSRRDKHTCITQTEEERKATGIGCSSFIGGENWWAVEPELGRVAHGIPSRVDRLKALGNAVVPQQIYPVLKAIADIERLGI